MFTKFKGTSVAAPIAAGVAALALSRARALDPSGALAAKLVGELEQWMRETSIKPERVRRVAPRALLTRLETT